jgi:hypothetical protein
MDSDRDLVQAFFALDRAVREPHVSVPMGLYRLLVLGAAQAEAITTGKAAELLGVDVIEVRRLLAEMAGADAPGVDVLKVPIIPIDPEADARVEAHMAGLETGAPPPQPLTRKADLGSSQTHPDRVALLQELADARAGRDAMIEEADRLKAECDECRRQAREFQEDARRVADKLVKLERILTGLVQSADRAKTDADRVTVLIATVEIARAAVGGKHD